MQTIPVKSILSPYSLGGWFGSNHTANLYRGCCHGCIYCDSRSECYGTPEFDTVRLKEHATALLLKELRSRKRRGVVLTGSMGDPYNPYEREARATEQMLTLLHRFGFGVVVVTKSDLVVRDTALLAAIHRRAPAAVLLSVTTADDALCRRIEPGVCTSQARFEALAQLSAAGIPCGVLLTPVLPFINDTEENIRGVVRGSARAGARWVYAGEGMGVTLRANQRQYFYERLDALFPGIRRRYEEHFGSKYLCTTPDSTLWPLFRSECESAGLLWAYDDICEAIHGNHARERQLSIF